MPDQEALDAAAHEMGKLVDATTEAVAGELAAGLAGWATVAARGWLRAFGALEAPAGPGVVGLLSSLRTALAGAFAGAADIATRALSAALVRARALGVRQAREQLPPGADPPVPAPGGATPGARAALAPVAAMVGEQQVAALALLRPELVRASGYSALEMALGQARRAVTRLETHTAVVVVSAVDDAVAEVSQAAGMRRVWVAERDACLACTRLAGVVCDADGTWSKTATYGDTAPKVAGALKGAPRHPRCRCHTIPYAPDRDADWAAALRREAVRSVLRGWSLPSESGAARVRAADRLLATISPAGAPASVRQVAARAVREGHFPGRQVPVATR
ncbi:hypothetical protein CcI49_03335 [Frankia sp. CcI49]|uniref:hypothetical protein n=1 Tax=unclassified Frankia TaxID=2632575 RepID=UPI0006CA36E7|nr:MULTISPECIES: hypothetical protein [unclassified Frankia]KPM55746.1 hypothetical protein ACG83_10745 [Frankia sp. R43]ONH58394.1 hypothetical protein CcI49_23350 [Frankia sp. CcI49]ONH62426.1 hypothetical protein CcI49_03335 [Frankia sp. CcI49]